MLYRILLIAVVIIAPVWAFDIEDLGDFTSRSVIMNSISGKQTLNQEQRDILKSKKLTPTTKCLFEQIKKNDIDNVKLLLDFKVKPNETYFSDYPIYYASKLNRTEIVKLLYENGAKLDRGFYSELYEAVRNKNNELAQYLLDRGAKVNYVDSITNNTILSMALKNDMTDIAGQLIRKGAKADNRSLKLIKKKKLQNLVEENT